MTEARQHQLIGAVILALAGLIILPLILDGKGYKARHPTTEQQPKLITQTPMAPAPPPASMPPVTVVAAPEPTPAPPVTTMPANRPPVANTLPVITPPSPQKPTTELPPIAAKKPSTISTLPPPKREITREEKEVLPPSPPVAKTAPIATITTWRLQAGHFSQRTNAEKIQKTLSQRGYRAEIIMSNKNSQTTYRVYLGPFPSREQAEKIRAQIKQFGISSFIAD